MGMGMAEILREWRQMLWEYCGDRNRSCGNAAGGGICFFAGTVTMLVNCGTVVSKVLLQHTVYGEGTEHNIDGVGWGRKDAGIAASKH